MPVELLPCPFCGSKVVLQQNLMGQYGVFCLTLDCVDVGITSFNEEYVVRGWNRRTALAAPQIPDAAAVVMGAENGCDCFACQAIRSGEYALRATPAPQPDAPHPAEQAASSLAVAILQRTLDEGKSIHIPSLGITIEPPGLSVFSSWFSSSSRSRSERTMPTSLYSPSR